MLCLMSAVTTQCYAVGWIGPYTLATVEIGDGVTHFAATSSFLNRDGCTSPGFIAFDAANPLMDRIVAAGLAAKLAGALVRFLVNGCLSGYIHASRIEVD